MKVRTEELAQLAEDLQVREQQFRAVAETANDAIVSTDHYGLIVLFNPAAERMFGHTGSAIGRQSLAILIPDRIQRINRRGLEGYLATVARRLRGKTIESFCRRRSLKR